MVTKAKKKATSDQKQQSLVDSNGDIVQKPPKKLQEILEDYYEAQSQKGVWQQEMNLKRTAAVDYMRDHNIPSVVLDLPGGNRKVFESVEKANTIRMTKPKANPDLDDDKAKAK